MFATNGRLIPERRVMRISDFLHTCLLHLAVISSLETTVAQRDHKIASGITIDEEINNLLNLLKYLVNFHFQDCTTTGIYYDDVFESSVNKQLINDLVMNLSTSYYIKTRVSKTIGRALDSSKPCLKNFPEESCTNYVLFLKNLTTIKDVVEKQSSRKVIVVSKSSSWDVYEFLKNPVTRLYQNLVVVARSNDRSTEKGSLLLFTHKLYSDGIGSNLPVILTSWKKKGLTRPETILFPPKLKNGFNGHRFRVSASHKPPFAIRRVVLGTDKICWDGIDVRIISLTSKILNFTIDFREPGSSATISPTKAVLQEILSGKASMALGGFYQTVNLTKRFDTTYPHAYDCASFISLTSTALPRYRAVLGPFSPPVWVTLIFAYLGAMIPLTLSSRNSLLHFIIQPSKINEMFWFIFSTFTNCFTIRTPLVHKGLGQNAMGILIGLYWVFTIIVTSCYTSSIIAFITIPVYPTAMDTSNQLLYYRYRIGTLDHDGWESYFQEIDEPKIMKLFRKVELVPTVAEGLKNASRAYFWPYAFLGSKAMLEYIVQADFTPSWKTKRSLMHIGRECFIQFGVGIVLPKESLYSEKFSEIIQRASQAGLVQKITSDVKWDMQRSASGKYLQVSSERSLRIQSVEERRLTLVDIQGMFMVLGAGISISLVAIFLECGVESVKKHCFKRQFVESSHQAVDLGDEINMDLYSTWNFLDNGHKAEFYESDNNVVRDKSVRNSI
ncbi:ionotropic receptor 21a [Athalia rosae]|uniref:ionotropic receptor 21a n=1 Tax=Athalia rosae TaxID=37344 RepID=UPI002033BE51|nr:ionotropic receptor 21a [Athalia rosae]